MSDIDPLIKREIQWMALGVLENRDLAPLIIARVRRQRIRNFFLAALSVIAISGLSIVGFNALTGGSDQLSQDSNTNQTGVTGNNSANSPKLIGLQSDYPVTWEQSVGDLGAISGAGGIGDTLGGLTATGLKISWERCGNSQCPITWILSLENRTQDLISTSPSLGIFTNHTPIVSDSRPTTVLPGGTALLVYTFPEFQDSLKVEPEVEWQWNWYLAQLR